MEIKFNDMSFAYGDVKVLNDISLTIGTSELTCILGPNGVGKSTLMYCMNKLLEPTSGSVTIDGRDIKEIPLRDMAKIMSFVPHAEEAVFSMSVMDTVLMGRHPHSGLNMTSKDMRIAAENIKLLGIESLSMREFDELSAGQHQRVMIARGLTQEPQFLLLDEPTANLDVKYQMLVMKLLKDIARIKKIAVVVICHDLNVTSMYADRIVLLGPGGRIYADGKSDEVLTEEMIKTVYGIDAKVTTLQDHPHVALLDGPDLSTRTLPRFIPRWT
jgi:iron complex transport system ATP-binding protein